MFAKQSTMWIVTTCGSRTLAWGIDVWPSELMSDLPRRWEGTVEKTVTPHEFELGHADHAGLFVLAERIAQALADAFGRNVRLALQEWESPQEAIDRAARGWPTSKGAA